MKSFLSHTFVILLVRIFLGGLFIIAGLDKIGNPESFTASILNYKIVGQTLAVFTATILPPLELLCGVCLILGVYPRAGALVITGLLFVFTVLIASALFRGLDISCGCFSHDPQTGKLGFAKIFENAGMILLGVYLVFVRNNDFTLLQFISNKSEMPHH